MGLVRVLGREGSERRVKESMRKSGKIFIFCKWSKGRDVK